ncbi:MAG TPA: restriction endonuclease subunit S [Abditibacteriaceae bacterium]|jgi:type I restriction enzyme S subunit
MSEANWTKEQLGDFCHVVGGGTPSRQNPRYWHGSIPWASVKDFKDGQRFIADTEEHITPSGLAGSASRQIPAGTPLVCTRMAVGRSAIPLQDTAINQDVKALFTDGKMSADYLQRLLGFHENDISRTAVGSTVKGISTKELLLLQVFFPVDLAQQARIAEILDTADAAIRESESVLAKLRQLKAGLLHDLLTCGLDANGRLRDPLRYPEQFQDSPLGRIPKAWDATTLGQVIAEHGGMLQTGPFGSQLHSRDYSKHGVAVVMPQDIDDNGEIDVTGAAKILESRSVPLSRHRLRPTDLVFARRGDLSRCGVLQPGANAICGTGCLLFRPPEKVLLSGWFAMAYRHDFCQRQIANKAVGTTMVNLNTQLLNSLWLRLPSYEEQKQILAHLTDSVERIAAEESRLAKLHEIKRGLAHDLLSGRVRVIPMEI